MTQVKTSSNPLLHLGAGALSGSLSVVLLQPFDLLKTRVQQETVNKPILGPLHLNQSNSKSPNSQSNLVNVISGALSRAAAGFILMPATVVKMNLHVPDSLITASSGMMGGIIASYMTQPFDMIKTRMQIQPLQYRQFFQSFKKILSEEGYYGFFRGISLRVMRKGIQAAVTFSFYEWAIKAS
ncbi:Solute carrier family 25 member 38-like protein [Smittium mucronatum]|uniref:Solute carrier family 25 member 38-like protein n=1 Tax=Smittium mucronatum TaxID=133383 RepID=A0A1R0GLF8_9FUNG|nr:Solute carrier family 25 member 38-like protein [Smittium mucronatum]